MAFWDTVGELFSESADYLADNPEIVASVVGGAASAGLDYLAQKEAQKSERELRIDLLNHEKELSMIKPSDGSVNTGSHLNLVNGKLTQPAALLNRP